MFDLTGVLLLCIMTPVSNYLLPKGTTMARTKRPTAVQTHAKAMRKANWEARRDAMAEGRRERAATFADRRKVANKRACRNRHGWD
jgi:hypothetical protein